MVPASSPRVVETVNSAGSPTTKVSGVDTVRVGLSSAKMVTGIRLTAMATERTIASSFAFFFKRKTS